MGKWFITRKGAPFQEIAEKFHISPILARLIRNRDVIGDEAIRLYLHGTLDDLHDGILMKDMSLAMDILREKLQEEKKIRIIGDYDIDGINATYILLEGLGALGANVDMDIPDRIKDGYGLNRDLIERAYKDGIDTIITCDNGIAAREEIAFGKRLGMTIIVTDHHEIPYEEQDGVRQYLLPPADAVIDPKQADCAYPFKGLCGAAVAYKLVEVLFHVTGKDAEDVDYLMENVAIATVGDVMDLVGENRIFVKQGLEMLKRTQNLGLKALLECTKVDISRLSAYHIGFVIGPCLNASGRLDTAKRAIELLRAKSKKEADILAGDLKALNDNRKDMTAMAVDQAIELIEMSEIKKDSVLVIYLPECHESLAGIVAGRVRERYYKPTFVLTKAEGGVKGSGRSIESYPMFDKLSECKELLTRFGGHKLAAGVSLDEKNVDVLRKVLNEKAELTEDDLLEKVSIDMQLPFGYINEELVDALECLEPFGKGNPKPIFVEKGLSVVRKQIIGKNRNMLKLLLCDGQGITMEALYFGEAQQFEQFLAEHHENFAVTYYPSVNEYQGRKNMQIVIQNYQ